MNFGKRTPEAESVRIVGRALERGIRVFDTANAYSGGESERILGRALGVDRPKVLLSTKAGLAPAGPSGLRGKPEGLSPEVLAGALEASLARLGSSWVDVFYLHAPDRSTPIERTLEALSRFVAEGRVRSWGTSNYASWEIGDLNAAADRMGLVRPVVTQALYNLLHRELDIEYFAFARTHPIHTTTYNALAGGLLTGLHNRSETPARGSRFDSNPMYRRRYWSAVMFDRVESLRRVAEAEGCSLIQLSYAWLAGRADVDSVLIGAATVLQLDEAIDASTRGLSSSTLARLEELALEWSGTDTHYVR